VNESQGTEVRVYRRARASHFTTLPNALIRNQLPVRISSVAFRLATILLSFPEQGWKTSRDELARRYFTEGVKQVQKALAELANAGLFRRARVRNSDGTFSWTWEIADEPVFRDSGPEDSKSAGHTIEQKPLTGEKNVCTNPQVTPLSKNHSLVNHSVVNDSVDSSYIEITPPSSIPPPPSGAEKPPEAEAAETFEVQARELLAQLGEPWRLGAKSVEKLIPLVVAALCGSTGRPWPVEALAKELARDPEGVRSPLAVLRARLSDLPPAPAPKPTKPLSAPWCGSCASETRRWIDDTPDGNPMKCPKCHPERTSRRPGVLTS
jgi:hypothetical protein